MSADENPYIEVETDEGETVAGHLAEVSITFSTAEQSCTLLIGGKRITIKKQFYEALARVGKHLGEAFERMGDNPYLPTGYRELLSMIDAKIKRERLLKGDRNPWQPTDALRGMIEAVENCEHVSFGGRSGGGMSYALHQYGRRYFRIQAALIKHRGSLRARDEQMRSMVSKARVLVSDSRRAHLACGPMTYVRVASLDAEAYKLNSNVLLFSEYNFDKLKLIGINPYCGFYPHDDYVELTLEGWPAHDYSRDEFLTLLPDEFREVVTGRVISHQFGVDVAKDRDHVVFYRRALEQMVEGERASLLRERYPVNEPEDRERPHVSAFFATDENTRWVADEVLGSKIAELTENPANARELSHSYDLMPFEVDQLKELLSGVIKTESADEIISELEDEDDSTRLISLTDAKRLIASMARTVAQVIRLSNDSEEEAERVLKSLSYRLNCMLDSFAEKGSEPLPLKVARYIERARAAHEQIINEVRVSYSHDRRDMIAPVTGRVNLPEGARVISAGDVVYLGSTPPGAEAQAVKIIDRSKAEAVIEEHNRELREAIERPLFNTDRSDLPPLSERGKQLKTSMGTTLGEIEQAALERERAESRQRRQQESAGTRSMYLKLAASATGKSMGVIAEGFARFEGDSEEFYKAVMAGKFTL